MRSTGKHLDLSTSIFNETYREGIENRTAGLLYFANWVAQEIVHQENILFGSSFGSYRIYGTLIGEEEMRRKLYEIDR
jgi:hypothetical protein